MNTESMAGAATRRVRWRRSEWHRLLVAIDARARSAAVPTARLLGVDEAQSNAWLDAIEPMSVRMQWLLVHVGEACGRDDVQLARATATLRAQLEARAAFVSRGPVHTTLTAEGARAMRG